MSDEIDRRLDSRFSEMETARRQAGQHWDERFIYETNLRTSYATGRWAQLHDPALQKRAPYWHYIHADGVLSPRPQHQAWGDSRLTLRFDHPFW